MLSGSDVEEGNAGVGPSRAACAGVPLSEMPPPLLTHILRLLSYQTGRCLLTFCGCHTHTHLERPSLSAQRKGDHYCCRRQLFLYMHSITGFLSLFTLVSRTPTQLACSHTRVSAYSGGFCEPVAYTRSYISALPSVGPGSSVCRVIDMIVLGNGGKIC